MMYKILIIEDDEDIREMVRLRIEGAISVEFEIIEAENGLKGFNLLNQDSPDIIITDLAMPHMNGLELMKLLEIKSHKVPVLVFSGKDEFYSLAKRFEQVKVYTKPDDFDQLISEVTRLCKRR